MKMRFMMLLLCVLLAGCAAAQNQAAESAQAETVLAEENNVQILPLQDTTMEMMEDSTVHISMEQGDFYRDASGNVVLRMQVYSYDKFDMVDISLLKAGDTILLSGEEIPVDSVERTENGTVLVNGGLDEGGFDLATDDSGIYFVHGYNDMKSWYLVGEAEYPVADEFAFTDGADLERGAITYGAEDILAELPEAAYGYQPQNTMVRIENGQVVAMERIFMP